MYLNEQEHSGSTYSEQGRKTDRDYSRTAILIAVATSISTSLAAPWGRAWARTGSGGSSRCSLRKGNNSRAASSRRIHGVIIGFEVSVGQGMVQS